MHPIAHFGTTIVECLAASLLAIAVIMDAYKKFVLGMAILLIIVSIILGYTAFTDVALP